MASYTWPAYDSPLWDTPLKANVDAINAEVEAATLALGQKLTRADLIQGSGISLTNGSGNTVIISATGGLEPLAERTNLFRDPLATGTNATRFGGLLNYTTTYVSNFPVPVEFQADLGGATTTTAIRSTRTATGASRIACLILGADMLRDGENITVYALVRAGKPTTLNTTARPAVATSTNSTSLGSFAATTTPQLAVFTGQTYTVANGASAGIAFAIPTVTSIDADDWVEMTLVGVEVSSVVVSASGDERPVFGSRVDNTRGEYAWSGTANDSFSTQTPVDSGGVEGLAGLYHIEDYGAVPGGLVNSDAALAAALAAANASGGAVYIPRHRSYNAKLDATNTPVIITGGGTLVQRPGENAVRISMLPLEEITLTSQALDRVGPSTSSDTKPTNRVTRLNVAASNLVKFKPRGEWLIGSQDVYPWSNRPGGGSSTEYPVAESVYQQDWFTVMGIVIPFTPSGTWNIREGDTITGATSGASAQVIAHHADQLLVRIDAGTFTTTENLTVGGVQGGTITGAAWIAVQGVIDATYTTSPVLKRMPDYPVYLDVNIDTASDPDTILGLAAREPAIRILCCKRPVIIPRTTRTYQAGINLISNYQPYLVEQIDAAPNIVYTGGTSSNAATEGAYGYGVETIGCNVGGYVHITATGVRHAFSINQQEWSTFPASTGSRLLNGVSRDMVITGTAHDCFAAAWDTHEGAERITFINCHSYRSMAGGRYASGTAGFNNRSHNTRFINCHSHGDPVGFNDGSSGHRLNGGKSTTEFIDCTATDWMASGFRTAQVRHATDLSRTRFIRCRSRGNGDNQASPFDQNAFDLMVGNIEMIGCVAERFNGDAVVLNGTGLAASALVVIDDLTVDMSEAPNTSGVDSIRIFSGTNMILRVGKVKLLQRTDATGMPTAVVRNQSGNAVIRFFDEQVVLNTTTTVPRFTIDAGTPTLGYVPGAQPRLTVKTTAPTDAISTDVNIHPTTKAVLIHNGSAWA
jgi:hypothetical protein